MKRLTTDQAETVFLFKSGGHIENVKALEWARNVSNRYKMSDSFLEFVSDNGLILDDTKYQEWVGCCSQVWDGEREGLKRCGSRPTRFIKRGVYVCEWHDREGY